MTPKIIGDCKGKMKFDMSNKEHSDELPNFFAPLKSAQHRHISRNDNYDSSEYEFTDSCHYNIRNELLESNAHTHSPNTRDVIQEMKLSSNGDEEEFLQDLQSWDLSSRGLGVMPLELAQLQRSSHNDTFDSDSFANKNESNYQVEYQTKQNPKAISDQGLIMAKVYQREDQSGKAHHHLKTSYDGKSGIVPPSSMVVLNLPQLPLDLPKFQRSSYQSVLERLEKHIAHTCIDTTQNDSATIQRPSDVDKMNFSNESCTMASSTGDTEAHLKTSYDGKSGSVPPSSMVALNLPQLPLVLPKFQRRSSYQSERERLEKHITHTCIDTILNDSATIQRPSDGDKMSFSNESTLASSDNRRISSRSAVSGVRYTATIQRPSDVDKMNFSNERNDSATIQRPSDVDKMNFSNESCTMASSTGDNRSISSRSAVSGVRYTANEGGRYAELYKQGTHKLRMQAVSRQHSPPSQAPNPAASHANPTQLALYEKGVSKARTLRARMIDEKREIASKEAKKLLPTTNACCDRLYNLSKSKQSSKQVKVVSGEKRVIIPTTNARCDRLYNLSKAKQEKQRQDRELLKLNKKIVTPTANARCDRLYNLSRKKQLTGKMRRQQAFEKCQINMSLSSNSKYTQLAKIKSVGSRSDRVTPASKRRVVAPAVNRRRIIPTIQKKIDSETKELAQLVRERIASKSMSLDHKFEKHRAENDNDLFLEDTNGNSKEFVADFLRITSPTTNSSKKGGLGSWSRTGMSTAADTLDQFLKIKIMQTTMNEEDDDGRQISSCPLASTDLSSAHSPPQSLLGNNSNENIDLELKSKLKSLKTLAAETNSNTYIGTSTGEYYDNSYHSSDKNLAVRDPTDQRARDCYSQGIESRDCSSASLASGDYGVGRTMPDEDGYYSESIDERIFPSSDGTQIIGVDPTGTNPW
eukprot:CAMPEP_0194095262 /NCGR_PEP_ID=MMETSP0149-20130528/56733_1 /TAXON_ID=122233 /ORGANISM="Chaetoceros debilis, Strain MM31A-1" /LENGTH=922 /DNA_ID=CAMNT_0038781203 /DNA_START=115 /DNA_END=2881 /DNA_ORIENTATION=+